jgi:hypothetical protein
MRDCFLPAAIWPRLLSLDAVEQAAFFHLWAPADRDGIAPVDPDLFPLLVEGVTSLADPDHAVRRVTIESALLHAGVLVAYRGGLQAGQWAWIPDVPLHAPPPSLARPVEASWPAPQPDAIASLLRVRLGRDPTEKECRAACPRAYGRKSAPSVPTDDHAERVFKAWAARQDAPERCRLSPASRRLIASAMKEVGGTDAEASDALALLFRYVFEADEKGPRYLRDNGYVGLDNLLVLSKIQSRLASARAWEDRKAPPPEGAPSDGVDLGPLARFR